MGGFALGGRRLQNGLGSRRQQLQRWSFHGNQVHTIFVDNLPMMVAKRDLYIEFGKDGSITNVFVSRKQRTNPFAFVRFDTFGRAKKAIERMNRTTWR
ncbi:hypothetical protein PIB30_094888, partial [Stylosanthes scabra]|nr:hypothetical protein [Stylosanthes scabra]